MIFRGGYIVVPKMASVEWVNENLPQGKLVSPLEKISQPLFKLFGNSRVNYFMSTVTEHYFCAF
jgi:hypothetical protein